MYDNTKTVIVYCFRTVNLGGRTVYLVEVTLDLRCAARLTIDSPV